MFLLTIYGSTSDLNISSFRNQKPQKCAVALLAKNGKNCNNQFLKSSMRMQHGRECQEYLNVAVTPKGSLAI